MPTAGEREELAASYGWALSVLNSDRDLRRVFNLAVAGTWSPARFIAEVRKTAWFRRNSETARQQVILARSDPATYRARRAALSSQIADLGQQMGAHLSARTIGLITNNAAMLGWTQNQIRDALANYVGNTIGKRSGFGYFGEAARNFEKLDSYARAMGLSIGGAKDNWVRAIARGVYTADDYVKSLRGQAEKLYPLYADQFRRGLTLTDVAQPYMQSMATLLETPASKITVFDPRIRGALNWRDPKTGQSAAMSLTDFENGLRRDPAWRRTKNAADQTFAVAHQLLQQFGQAV